MQGMTLEKIAKACDGKLLNADPSDAREADHVDIDSRKVGQNGVFIAIKGERADGHSFIKSVMEKGALCAIGEVIPEELYGPYILVESTLKAIRDIAEYYRSVVGVKVVGITGSVGKTSTKEMISSVLSQHYSVHKTAGNFNNEIGLPLTVFGIRPEHEVAVLEMGISDFGEMHRLGAIAKPDVMTFTNIGLCHLENLGDRDGILRAKTECLDHVPSTSVAVLNGDDDKLGVYDGHPELKKYYYSVAEEKDVYATDVDDKGMEGIDFKLHVFGEETDVHEPLPGSHNICNALAAATVGHILGLSNDEIKRGIESASTIAGRSNMIHSNGITIIDDCYNANPVSMKASIDVLSKASGRTIAVLGDMGELGKDEKALHYQVGEHAAKSSITAVFAAGELSKEIVRALKDNKSEKDVFWFADKESMTEEIKKYKKEGDTILVKASHFMAFSSVVEVLK